MAEIAILVEPDRATRIFFDCSAGGSDPADQRRIQQAIEQSILIARADEDTFETPTLLAVGSVPPTDETYRPSLSHVACRPASSFDAGTLLSR